MQNLLIDRPINKSPFKIDLAATNINRGRDHGIPSYNKFRELCGLGLANSFSDLNNTMPR